MLRIWTVIACLTAATLSLQGAPEITPKKVVTYRDFGAKGDGKTDDFNAIVAAHAYANEHQLPVRAEDRATYYIGGAAQTANIQTDTDFGKAKFIIDDTAVKNRNSPVFSITSKLKSFTPQGLATLKKDQRKIDIKLPGPCVIMAQDADTRRYIRYGLNQNSGAPQTDVFIVDRDGNVDMKAPIIWDFDKITKLVAYPIDEQTLKVTGGRFTTVANQEKGRHKYYHRGIAIRRSNTVIDGLEHRITGEGEESWPYSGFINITDCANVTVKNTVLTGHKCYKTVSAQGPPVTTGTYDIGASRALNVSFINCSQTNSITDPTYWGIMGTNYCKNLLLDNCKFSRFDAHMGVANATIRNSTLGHMGINAIGSGTLLLENTTTHGHNLINLRSDYGSTWQGKFIIRNCVFIPANGRKVTPAIIGGANSGQHNFGYVCYMPEVIEIDGLVIKDRNHPDQYAGPAILAGFNAKNDGRTYQEKFPYVKTREVIVRNLKTESGKKYRLSENPDMFRDVKVKDSGRK